MFSRMKAVRVTSKGGPDAKGFGIVLVHYGDEAGVVSYEFVAYGDNYALADFYATMYNVGKYSARECKDGMEKGLQGIRMDNEDRADLGDRRYNLQRGVGPTEGQEGPGEN